MKDKVIKCLIVSHNNRLRTFLSSFFDIPTNVKFRNQAIVKLKISKRESKISLFSEGCLRLKKKGRYFGEGKNDIDVKNIENFEFKPLKTKSKIIDWSILKHDLEIYLVRHGESYGNIRDVKVILDPLLTDHGKKNSVKKDLKDLCDKIDYFFVSSLVRTRQTLKALCPKQDKEVFILPCAKECLVDKNNKEKKINSFSNIRNIFRTNIPKGMKINWKYNKDCHKESNMIKELVKIIEKESK